MIFSFLCGEYRYSVPAGRAAFLTDLCRARGILLFRGEHDGKGNYLFSCRAFAAKRLLAACQAVGLAPQEVSGRGVPVLLGKILRRPGLVAGAVAALLLLCLSPLFLWDIEITGNETLSVAEIEEELALAGLSRGAFLPRTDTDRVAGELRLADARLSYVTVNLRGTVARVQVRETKTTPSETAPVPAHLVATKDGVVTLPLVFEGQCLVREGEIVRAGQLLASGLIGSENNGTRVTRAAGQVLAKTEHEITVNVPYCYEIRTPLPREGREVTLTFFGKTQKLFKTTGNATDTCDIIINNNRWILPGGRALPFCLFDTKTVFYTLTQAKRTPGEALELARAELSAALADFSVGGTLLSTATEVTAGEEGITLLCTVVLEENIAAPLEFALTD